MSTAVPLRDIQKLKVIRTEDGQVNGCLQCSIVIAFGGAEALCFEDCLMGIPVAEVLNPLHDIFLADEVQRLMRVGIAAWLELELSAGCLVGIAQAGEGCAWNAHFRLPTTDGETCDLHINVPASAAHDQVKDLALEAVQHWAAALDQRPADAVLLAILAELDLRGAPRLHWGLGRVSPASGTT